MQPLPYRARVNEAATNAGSPSPFELPQDIGSYFVYGTDADAQALAAFLTERGFMIDGSSGEAVFPDPTVVDRELAAHPELYDVILYTGPIAGQAATERMRVLQYYRTALLSTGLSAAVLLASALLLAYLYARVAAQWIFAHHLHGRAFIRVHRWFLLAVAVALVWMAALIPYRVWQDNREYYAAVEAGFAPRTSLATVGPESLVAIAAVLVLLAATALIATGIAHRRIVRHGAAEA